MQIEPCNPEIVGLENYVPTEIENMFMKPKSNSVVIVWYYGAYKIATNE